jgi:dihydrofolate reductase
MTKVRVAGFSISLDGFGAGPEQSLENPLGKRGRELHQWFLGTRTFRAMTGEGGGSDGVDEAYAHRSMDGFGAFILGRNMFGPIRGPWPDQSWKGWWGANPPYHAPTFVLTHHPRDPIEMEGGTTFIFVTKGIKAALDQAKQAANGRLRESGHLHWDRAQKVALADINAAMTQDRVGGCDVEIEVRQHEMVEVIVALHVALVGRAERERDLTID